MKDYINIIIVFVLMSLAVFVGFKLLIWTTIDQEINNQSFDMEEISRQNDELLLEQHQQMMDTKNQYQQQMKNSRDQMKRMRDEIRQLKSQMKSY